VARDGSVDQRLSSRDSPPVLPVMVGASVVRRDTDGGGVLREARGTPVFLPGAGNFL
jgi:hypothetical protein